MIIAFKKKLFMEEGKDAVSLIMYAHLLLLLNIVLLPMQEIALQITMQKDIAKQILLQLKLIIVYTLKLILQTNALILMTQVNNNIFISKF